MPRDSPPHRARSRSPRRRDNGYPQRDGGFPQRDSGYAQRDSGYAQRDRQRSPREPRRDAPGDYTAMHRVRERDADRKRYEDDVKPGVDGDAPPKSPPKPNFGSSGLLAKETNTVKGVQLKYNEPPEARKPLKNWRLYVFKGEEQVDLIHIYKQSAYLVGRDEVVTDIPIAHPSCSKQHAAIQFRQVTARDEFGETSTAVKPFIIDLDSTNGTYVNDEEVPKSRYYELRNTDVIKFGTSSREYVLLHEDAGA